MENVKCFVECADVMVYCIGSYRPNVKDPVIEVCNTIDRLYLHFFTSLISEFSWMVGSFARTFVGWPVRSIVLFISLICL